MQTKEKPKTNLNYREDSRNLKAKNATHVLWQKESNFWVNLNPDVIYQLHDP